MAAAQQQVSAIVLGCDDELGGLVVRQLLRSPLVRAVYALSETLVDLPGDLHLGPRERARLHLVVRPYALLETTLVELAHLPRIVAFCCTAVTPVKPNGRAPAVGGGGAFAGAPAALAGGGGGAGAGAALPALAPPPPPEYEDDHFARHRRNYEYPLRFVAALLFLDLIRVSVLSSGSDSREESIMLNDEVIALWDNHWTRIEAARGRKQPSVAIFAAPFLLLAAGLRKKGPVEHVCGAPRRISRTQLAAQRALLRFAKDVTPGAENPCISVRDVARAMYVDMREYVLIHSDPFPSSHAELSHLRVTLIDGSEMEDLASDEFRDNGRQLPAVNRLERRLNAHYMDSAFEADVELGIRPPILAPEDAHRIPYHAPWLQLHGPPPMGATPPPLAEYNRPGTLSLIPSNHEHPFPGDPHLSATARPMYGLPPQVHGWQGTSQPDFPEDLHLMHRPVMNDFYMNGGGDGGNAGGLVPATSAAVYNRRPGLHRERIHPSPAPPDPAAMMNTATIHAASEYGPPFGEHLPPAQGRMSRMPRQGHPHPGVYGHEYRTPSRVPRSHSVHVDDRANAAGQANIPMPVDYPGSDGSEARSSGGTDVGEIDRASPISAADEGPQTTGEALEAAVHRRRMRSDHVLTPLPPRRRPRHRASSFPRHNLPPTRAAVPPAGILRVRSGGRRIALPDVPTAAVRDAGGGPPPSRFDGIRAGIGRLAALYRAKGGGGDEADVEGEEQPRNFADRYDPYDLAEEERLQREEAARGDVGVPGFERHPKDRMHWAVQYDPYGAHGDAYAMRHDVGPRMLGQTLVRPEMTLRSRSPSPGRRGRQQERQREEASMFYSPHGSFDGSGSLEQSGELTAGGHGGPRRRFVAPAPRRLAPSGARDGYSSDEAGLGGALVDYRRSNERHQAGDAGEYDAEEADDNDDDDPYAYPPLRHVATDAPVGNGSAFAAELAQQRRQRRRQQHQQQQGRRRQTRGGAAVAGGEGPEPMRGRLVWNLVDQALRPGPKHPPPVAVRARAVDVREVI